MGECYSAHFFKDGQLHSSQEFQTAWVHEGRLVYEVLRVREGVPLFWDDHLTRLLLSCRLAGYADFPDAHLLLPRLKVLIEKEDIRNGNVKLLLNLSGSKPFFLMYFVETHYPAADVYLRGVETLLYPAERKNPRAKIVRHVLRTSIYKKLILTGRWEALLVNESGCITEGSRSNVFFIQKGKLLTPPSDWVLEGITRSKVLEICRKLHIEVKMEAFPVAEMSKLEAAFLTGTSIGILPISRIDETALPPEHKLISLLSEAYRKTENDYISAFKQS